MAWILVVRKIAEYSHPEDQEVLIEFCWGKKKSDYNSDTAKVFLNHFREALRDNDLSKLATAFNVPVLDTDFLAQFVALLHVLWHWEELRKAKWISYA